MSMRSSAKGSGSLPGPRLVEPRRKASAIEAAFSGLMEWMTSVHPSESKAQSIAAIAACGSCPCLTSPRAARGKLERVDARDFAADHQLVHRLGAFVGDHGLEVERVADGRVLGGDTGAAEDVARLARDIDGHAAVVPLRQRHLRRLHRARVLQAAQ